MVNKSNRSSEFNNSFDDFVFLIPKALQDRAYELLRMSIGSHSRCKRLEVRSPVGAEKCEEFFLKTTQNPFITTTIIIWVIFDALRVSRAVTRLTVYRPLEVAQTAPEAIGGAPLLCAATRWGARELNLVAGPLLRGHGFYSTNPTSPSGRCPGIMTRGAEIGT